MKKKIFNCISAFLLIFACCNTNSNKTLHGLYNNEIDCKDSLANSSYSEDALAFCPVLLEAIRSFIKDYSDEYDSVISVEIKNHGRDCFVIISTNMFYYTHLLCGYQIIDDKMIAYNYNFINDSISYYHLVSQLNTEEKKEFLFESECSKNLIDNTKLKTDFPTSFPNEHSDLATGWNYEPRCRQYRIHSPDSLELVFEGYY